MNNNKSNIIFFIFILIIFLSSCSSYNGGIVGMDHPLICRCQTFPVTCTQSDDKFIIEYNINELNQANRYLVEGSATHTGSATWVNFKNASFTLLLVEKGVIVETVSIAGGQGSLDRTIKFTREFTAQNKFEAVMITYRMGVRG